MTPVTLVAVVAAVLVFSAFTAQDPPSEPRALRGVVLDAATGQPVKKAAVIVRRQANTMAESGFGTLTDSAGRFEFTGLEEGTWNAEVQRDGYVSAGSTTDESKKLKWRFPPEAETLTVRLTPAGIITGRVLDQDGEPVAGASVNALPVAAKAQAAGIGSYAQTNDLGEYRLFNVAPGRYFVVAGYEPQWKRMGVRVVTKRGKAQRSEDYVATYYPAGIDSSEAAPVAVAAGRQVQGMDIRLQRALVVHVRGRVIAPEGGMGPFGFVSMVEPRSGAPAPGRNLTTIMRPDGGFEFDSVRPGRYLVQCTAGIQEKEQLIGKTFIDVADGDLDGVQVILTAPRTIQGKLTVETGAPLPEGLHAILISREEDPTHRSGGLAKVQKDGTFTLEGVYGGQYDLGLAKLNGEPDDDYVSRMRLGDEDVLDDGLKIGAAAPGKLEVTLRDDGGTIECTVVSADGKPLDEAFVTAVPQEHPHAVVLFGQGQTDDKGLAKLQGLAPGAYKIYAFEGRPAINVFAADALKPFEDNGKTARVEAKQTSRVEVKAVRQDEIR